MIQLYNKGTTTFTKHGIELHPTKASVTYQDNGRFDLDVEMPVPDGITFDYGQVIRCTVPRQEIGAITLGTVAYWKVNTGLTDVPLYSQVPTWVQVGYSEWFYSEVSWHDYAVGDKVTYNGANYQCVAWDSSSPMCAVPPANNSDFWTSIAGGYQDAGKTVATLDGGDTVFKTGDFNSTYMKASDSAGHEGFIEIAKCTDQSQTETRTIPAQVITEQSFTITEIEKSSDGKKVSLHAEHISYQLGRCILGDCNLVRVNPATAVMMIRGAMQETYPGNIYTNLTEETVTADWSWKNAQNAILDPKAGLLQFTAGRMLRNDLDVFLIHKGTAAPKYRVTYGTNMLAVNWEGSVSEMVTRVYPTAQNADGSTLLLPEKYIDTVRTVPFIRPEVLRVNLKVGDKEKQSDGTEIELTEDVVYTRMREAANNRFSVDECDKPDIRLEVDWLHLPDSEEWANYRELKNAAPGEWVEVLNGPLGVNETIQLTGYTFDAILERYEKCTFGKNKVSSGVASYDIHTGAVTGRAIGSGAVSGQNIQANSITAREIEANSITSDKIAARSIDAEHIAAQAITAEAINAGAVTAEKIAANAVTAEKIAAGSITAAAIGADAIQAGHIASGAITTDKLAAGAVDATKIAALAITTEKLAAGAITADKIGAGEVTAGKISADFFQAQTVQAGVASIANATIASADINYAHVKDLAADTAIFETSITEQGVADRLYINRLLITYGQMVEATIGDLVIGASNGNYYHVDVEWDEDGVPQLVPTQVATPSAAEIAAGHTSNGKTIIGNVGTFAELSSEDFYAINSIIDRITAKRIDVDELWARQAFIDKLMVQDISSNTYIQSTIGNWQSQSTITQTVNSLSSRIDQLGYGTIFYSETEPSHENLVAGDIWIEPVSDNTWADIGEYTWDELSSWTWEQVAGKYRMYVWTGDKFKILYDNLIISELQTEINQNAYAITLKANQSAVDTLSGEVSDFAATLEVQAQAITAAVSAVNAKTANYTQPTDPADDPTITLNMGDTWTKVIGDGNTWNGLASYDWNDLADLTWDELAGASVYTWTGTGWIQTADIGAELNNRSMIEQTANQIELLVESTMSIGEDIYTNKASIKVQADRITQEVERATRAEDGKIAKTTQYQTADQIVSEAVSESNSYTAGYAIQKTGIYQSAAAIVQEAVRQSATAGDTAYIKKTSSYQTADAIVNEAVRASGAAAASNYVAQTSNYRTIADIIAEAEALASAAETSAKGASIAKTQLYQSANAIVLAAESYTDANAYGKVSGITITSSGIDISGSQYVKIASGGYFKVTTGDFMIDTSIAADTGYVMLSGSTDSASASFRLKKNGELTVKKLLVLDKDGNETELDMKTAQLWKLNGCATIASYDTDSDGYVSSMLFCTGERVNFKSAALAYDEGVADGEAAVDYDTESAWSGGYKTLKLTNGKIRYINMPDAATWSSYWPAANVISVTCNVGGRSFTQSFTRSN